MQGVTRGRARSGWLPHLSLAMAAALLGPAAARAQEELVKVDDRNAISNAGIYIAIEKGYYKEAGIRNELITFASAAKTLPALTAGELDVSAGSPSAGLFNAIAQGAPFRIVADKGQARTGTGYSLLVVRKDLVDSGQVKTLRDLKGRKVAVFAKAIRAATPHYQARDGRPSLESLADQIAWFVANGFMPEKISVDRVVDLSFLK